MTSGTLMRNVRFLGHDESGQAVFHDLEYPSDAPRTVDMKTGEPTQNSPNVFRMSPEMARHRYGDDYERRGRDAEKSAAGRYGGPRTAAAQAERNEKHSQEL
jgi:hypothetical protein